MRTDARKGIAAELQEEKDFGFERPSEIISAEINIFSPDNRPATPPQNKPSKNNSVAKTIRPNVTRLSVADASFSKEKLPALPASSATNNDLVAMKHTGAVHVANTMTLMQRKAANVLLSYAHRNMLTQELHRVKLSELARDMGWSKQSNSNDKLKDSIKKLNITQIEWNILGKDSKHEWGIATVLAEATIKNGYCTYAYSPTMRKLQANPNIYAKLDLVVQQSFERAYTLALWEFLTEALCSAKMDVIRTSWVQLSDFKRLMGVATPYYDKFSKLNSKIIGPAIDELNEKSDINVQVDVKKEGRSVIALAFCAQRKPEYRHATNIAEDIPQVEYSFAEELLITLQQEFGFSHKNALKLIGEFAGMEAGEIINTLNHIRDRHLSGDIKNLQAYTVMALKDGYAATKRAVPEEEVIVIEEKAGLHPSWQEIRKAMKERIGEPAYNSWIHELQLESINEQEGSVFIRAKSAFICNWIKLNYEKTLAEFWHAKNNHITQVVVSI